MSKEGTTQHNGEQGPVSVADLLAQYQSTDESGTGHTGQAPAETNPMFVTDLLRREGRNDDEPPAGQSSRTYRTAAVLAGFVLLCGAVTAGTAALSGPRAERTIPAAVAEPAITGVEALRPDLLNNPGEAGSPPAAATEDPGRTGDGRSPPSTARSLPPVGPAESGTADPPPPLIAEPPPPEPTPDQPREVSEDPVPDIVSRFYQTVTVQPEEAFELLDPSLRSVGYQQFRQAWTGVQQATVKDIRQDGPSAVLVTVSLEQRDGSVLHTLQRVLVIPGAEPRIADVALLSASRS